MRFAKFSRPEVFRSVVLDAFSLYRPRQFREVADDVRADYGTFTERSLNRALRELTARGDLIKLPGECQRDIAYIKTREVLLTDDGEGDE